MRKGKQTGRRPGLSHRGGKMSSRELRKFCTKKKKKLAE